MRILAIGVVAVVAGLAFAVPAGADPDTEFSNQLQTYGIYGQRDYNAWIGKITCKRLHTGVAADADQAVQFVVANLHRGATTVQAWQFLGAAINTYCADQIGVLERIAEKD